MRLSFLRPAFVLGLLLLLLPSRPGLPQGKEAGGEPLRRIAFGSCARQDQPQPIWDAIMAARPDLFLMIGDNIYGDTDDMEVLRAKYAQLGAIPGFQRLRASVPLLAVWDDHDFGKDDVGEDYPKRVESQQVFMEFFREPADSPRRKHPGLYLSQLFGPVGKRTQVILLDARYFRSKLTRRPNRIPGEGPYVPNNDPASTMLGEEQWRWLEEQLRVPAQLRVIASGVQVVPEDHSWEKWMNMPHERERLFRLLRETKAGGVLFLSGDRHLAELSMMDAGLGYPVYDLTSSGLNQANETWRKYEANRHRVGTMNWGDNFGLVAVDWDRPDPRVSLQIRDVEGDVNIQRKINLSTIQPGTIK